MQQIKAFRWLVAKSGRISVNIYLPAERAGWGPDQRIWGQTTVARWTGRYLSDFACGWRIQCGCSQRSLPSPSSSQIQWSCQADSPSWWAEAFPGFSCLYHAQGVYCSLKIIFLAVVHCTTLRIWWGSWILREACKQFLGSERSVLCSIVPLHILQGWYLISWVILVSLNSVPDLVIHVSRNFCWVSMFGSTMHRIKICL